MRKIVQCSIVMIAGAPATAGWAAPGVAQEPVVAATEPWQPVDASTGQIRDIEGLEALAEAFPNSSSVRLRLLNAYVAAERFGQAMAVAQELAGEGYAFSSATRGYLQGLVLTGLMPPWLASNELNAVSVSASEAVATLPEEAQLPEGLAVSPQGGFMVTDVVARGWWHQSRDEWQFSSEADYGNLSGITDVTRRGAVMASSDLGMVPGSVEAFSGLLIPGIGRPLRVAAPDGVNLSDIARGPDGTVFASDPLGGGVYRLSGPRSPIMTLVAPGTLRSPQGLAPSEDGSRIYVSDYRYGLAMIDTRSGKVARLTTDSPMLLDGIDGLWLHEGELIGVQNGLSPMRIVALRLSEDGNRITAMRVLERANPEWTEPLGGDVHEGALYYIGNGSWDLFEEGGSLREGVELRATQVRRLELAENPTD